MRPILVVDDDDMVLEFVAACLRRHGFAAEAYDSAAQALGAIDAGLRPSLVILDLRMPGVDGNTLIERLREGPAAGVPRVLITAYLDDLRQDLRSEVVAVAEKPFACRDLIALVREVLGLPEGE